MDMKEIKKDVRMPVLGLGTWQLTGERCTDAVRKALELGYRHIDTAEMYGNEQDIREGIGDFDRKKLFITSKLWFENMGEDATEAFEGSLRRLGTDYLDLYLLHWPKEGMDLRGTFRSFRKLLDQGKVRAVGVSNFTVEHLKEALPLAQEEGIQLSMNQVEFHPLLNQKELHKFCSIHGISMTAYSPLARGNIRYENLMHELAEKYQKTAEQVSLRWLLQKELIVIPKGSSEEHLKENIDVFDFELEPEDMQRIEDLDKGQRYVNPEFAEFGKGIA